MALGLVGPLAFLGLLAYLLLEHGSEIGNAVNRAPAGTLLVATMLALVTLVARTEAATACMNAIGNRPSRLDIHPASAVSFLVSTINHFIASPVRAAVLKRLDPRRALTIPQMMLVDASTYLIEGALAAGLLVVCASTLKVRWWMSGLAVIGAATGFAAALTVRRRFAAHPMFRGLEMLAHSRQRLIVTVLVMIVFACQIGRTLLVLRATGLHPTLMQATATFVAAGILSALLAGPGAGTAGAPLLVFGHQSISSAAAAGLILSITALIASIAYTAAWGPAYAKRIYRRRKMEPQASALGQQINAVPAERTADAPLQ